MENASNSVSLKTFNNIKTNSYYVWYNQLIYFLIPFSLYCCFTNFVFLSAIGSVLVLLLPFLLTKENNLILQEVPRKILICLLFFTILCIFSILITHPSQLVSFDFFRRDGNFFISYAPLIVLICSAIKFDVWKVIKNFIYISTIANIIGIFIYFTKSTYLEYALFFTAHNAAGGFLGIVIIFNFALLCFKKNKWLPLLCLLINAFGLFLTDSRGSILPLLISFVFLLIFRKTRLKKIDIFINVCFFFVLFLFVLYVTAIRGSDTLVNMDLYFFPPEFKGGLIEKILASIGRSGTIVNRLYYLYPKALYMFGLSPIVGTGMGTYNDINFNFVGVQNFVCLNISSVVENNSSHAHNSFFHIMAENGIVGLVAIVCMLFYLRKYAISLKNRNLSNALFLGVNYVIMTSFFEHRLFTPAEILPIVYIVGIIISTENYKLKNAKLSSFNNFYMKGQTQ